MNSRRYFYMWMVVSYSFLMAGCFGGKAAAVRTEIQKSADTALSRGVRAEQKGNYPEADKLLSEALTISSSIEDNPARTMALINLARLHRLQHDLTKAETYLDQALVLVMTDPRLSAETAHEKALLELAKGNPAKAMEWARQSISAEQGSLLGNRLNLASRIQLVLGNWDEANTLARKALVENRSAGHAEEEANSLRIMGIVARNGKKYSEGEQFLREALSIDKRIGRSAKIATDLEELVTTSRSAGNLKESAHYLERAFDVNLAAGRLSQAIHHQEELAGIYALLGESSKAAKASETAQKLAVQNKSQQPQRSSETTKPSSRP